MDKAQLDPIADLLVPAYLDTASFSRKFRDDHDYPPTLATKVHHMRSVVQGMVTHGDRFLLGEDFTEFGRVELLDTETNLCFLLRSNGAVTIEQSLRSPIQGRLFDSYTPKYLKTTVILVVYRFHREGVDLSVTGTKQRLGRKRLEASGIPDYIGTWPYTISRTTTFDQGAGDAFIELGDMPDLGGEGGDAEGAGA